MVYIEICNRNKIANSILGTIGLCKEEFNFLLNPQSEFNFLLNQQCTGHTFKIDTDDQPKMGKTCPVPLLIKQKIFIYINQLHQKRN